MLCSEVQGFHEECRQLRLVGDQVLLIHTNDVLPQNVHKGTQAVLPKQKQSNAKATVTLTVTKKHDNGMGLLHFTHILVKILLTKYIKVFLYF